MTRLTEVEQMLYNPEVSLPPFIKKKTPREKVYRYNPHSKGIFLTSETRPQTVVIPIQQAVQDPSKQGDVGVEGI